MKGHTNNPYGRPKGTPNKITSTVRMWLLDMINNNREKLEEDFLKLEPKERLQLIERFLPYLMPKVERADEVEGACYNKADFEKKCITDIEIDKTELKKWYE